jgi:hypothetical protein
MKICLWTGASWEPWGPPSLDVGGIGGSETAAVHLGFEFAKLGHEVELHESWVGSCWYTPPSACWLNASALGNTVGVLINGNDHLLNQVVVFAGLVGVEVNGAANILTTVHTWNTQSGSVPDAVGIRVK